MSYRNLTAITRAQWIWQMSQELKPLINIKKTDLLLRKSRAGGSSSKTSQKQRGYWCGRCIRQSVQETSSSFTANRRKKPPEHSSRIASQGSWCSPVYLPQTREFNSWCLWMQTHPESGRDWSLPEASRSALPRSEDIVCTCNPVPLPEELVLQWYQPHETLTFIPFTSPTSCQQGVLPRCWVCADSSHAGSRRHTMLLLSEGKPVLRGEA